MYTTHAAALTMVADISVSRKVFFTRSNFSPRNYLMFLKRNR